MAVYLLDSNVLSEIMRNPRGAVARTSRRKEDDPNSRILTSIVVACEMRFGAAKKGSAPLTQRVNQTLASVEVVPLSAGSDDAYASLRTDLERRGQVIGQNDMLIAAHALALDAILVTDNVREFKRVKGLKIENWLRPEAGILRSRPLDKRSESTQ
jgi:tRNA(fMet)-specific endonuclease VapC